MIEVTCNLEQYYQKFRTYALFNNFLKYAIRDLQPHILVDDEEKPNCIVLYSNPAYFIIGEPDIEYIEDIFKFIHRDSWIITQSEHWKLVIESYYKEQVVVHPRVLYNSKRLDINYILKQRIELPRGLSIVPIENKHLKSGMIYDDVIKRFFTISDFLKTGFGFALVGEDGFCEGFSIANYPVIGKDIELYVRVGYDSYPDYRSKGLGTTLCSYFIEEALKRGYNPVWDSANETSSHMAQKLGYVLEKAWNIYHIL